MSSHEGKPNVPELASPQDVYELREQAHELSSIAGSYEDSPYFYRTALEGGGTRTVLKPEYSSDVGSVSLTETPDGILDVSVQYVRPEIVKVTLPPFGSQEPNRLLVIDFSGDDVRTDKGELTYDGCRSIKDFIAQGVNRNTSEPESPRVN